MRAHFWKACNTVSSLGALTKWQSSGRVWVRIITGLSSQLTNSLYHVDIYCTQWLGLWRKATQTSTCLTIVDRMWKELLTSSACLLRAKQEIARAGRKRSLWGWTGWGRKREGTIISANSGSPPSPGLHPGSKGHCLYSTLTPPGHRDLNFLSSGANCFFPCKKRGIGRKHPVGRQCLTWKYIGNGCRKIFGEERKESLELLPEMREGKVT